ncbi:transposase [Candidatus Kuenenbacteria bacterium]|nr:transposase [Candidatus Kuenenbacteria bacterium]
MKYQFFSGHKYFITYSLDDEVILSFDNKIKDVLLEQLEKAAQSTNTQIEPFSILNNHLHLIANTAEDSIPKEFLRRFAGASSRMINSYLKREGTLWKKYYGWAVFNDHAYFNIFA